MIFVTRVARMCGLKRRGGRAIAASMTPRGKRARCSRDAACALRAALVVSVFPFRRTPSSRFRRKAGASQVTNAIRVRGRGLFRSPSSPGRTSHDECRRRTAFSMHRLRRVSCASRMTNGRTRDLHRQPSALRNKRDPFAGPFRHHLRHAAPVGERVGVVGVLLALTGFGIGGKSVLDDKRYGFDLHEARGVTSAMQPSQHFRLPTAVLVMNPL